MGQGRINERRIDPGSMETASMDRVKKDPAKMDKSRNDYAKIYLIGMDQVMMYQAKKDPAIMQLGAMNPARTSRVFLVRLFMLLCLVPLSTATSPSDNDFSLKDLRDILLSKLEDMNYKISSMDGKISELKHDLDSLNSQNQDILLQGNKTLENIKVVQDELNLCYTITQNKSLAIDLIPEQLKDIQDTFKDPTTVPPSTPEVTDPSTTQPPTTDPPTTTLPDPTTVPPSTPEVTDPSTTQPPTTDPPTTTLPECPAGLFKLGTGECFKYVNDVLTNWADANSRCAEEGLYLAEPSDEVASALSKYLIDTYDSNNNAWLGGKATGSKWMWQRKQTELLGDNPLWWPGHSGATDNRCLMISVYKGDWNSRPGNPYISATCLFTYFTLCQAY